MNTLKEPLKIGDRLTELMMHNDIDCKTLAEKVQVNVSTASRWKNDCKYMRMSNAVKVADVLHCSLDFLVGRTDTVLDFTPVQCPPFYPRLRCVMKEKNVTRIKLTESTMIKSSHLVDWNHGADPNIVSLVLLADFFGISIDMLIGRDDSPLSTQIKEYKEISFS